MFKFLRFANSVIMYCFFKLSLFWFMYQHYIMFKQNKYILKLEIGFINGDFKGNILSKFDFCTWNHKLIITLWNAMNFKFFFMSGPSLLLCSWNYRSSQLWPLYAHSLYSHGCTCTMYILLLLFSHFWRCLGPLIKYQLDKFALIHRGIFDRVTF